MADSTARDLTAGTLAADTALIGQNTSAATRAERFAYSRIGGLVLAANTLTTANLTASVGTLHQLTIAGLTADRDFILPDTAAINERIGLYVVDGDVSFEVNIKTAATGSLLNGVDRSVNEWSKVFIACETLIFRCVNAGGAGDTDWIVEYDGRIPCVIVGGRGAAETATANSAFETVDLLDAVTVDNGSLHDTANERVLIRRAGNVLMSASLYITGASAPVAAKLAKNGTGVTEYGYVQLVVAGDNGVNVTGTVNVVSGDFLSTQIFISGTPDKSVVLQALSLMEIF